MFIENQKNRNVALQKQFFVYKYIFNIAQEFLNKHFDTVNLSFLKQFKSEKISRR